MLDVLLYFEIVCPERMSMQSYMQHLSKISCCKMLYVRIYHILTAVQKGSVSNGHLYLIVQTNYSNNVM